MEHEKTLKRTGGSINFLLHASCKRLHARGFTMLEILITITVISIIGTAAGISLITYYRTASVEAAAKDIVGELRLTQGKAISGEDGNLDGQRDAWGVHFSNSANDTYEVFYGNTYDLIFVKKTIFLPSAVKFTTPIESSSSDVIFTPITGTTTAATVVITTQDGSQTRTITVDANGRISSN